MSKTKNTRPLAALLDDLASDQPLALASLYRLSDLTQAELDLFTQRWGQLSPERRFTVVQHLADISEENFQVDFAPIFAYCLQDAAAPVRQAALEGLWDTDDTKLITPLLDLFHHDPVVEVRAAAAAALGHFVLLTEWGQFKPTTTARIVTALLAQLDNPHTAMPVRRAALEAVSSAAHERVPALIAAAYEDDREEMKAAALYAMGSQADPRWLKQIRLELENPSPLLREEAVRAAGNLGGSDLVEPLIEILHHDDDLSVQLAAVAALGQIGSEQAREALATLLPDAEAEPLREAIEEALEEVDMFASLSLFDLGADEEE